MSSKFCVQCGKPMEAGSGFCTSCGFSKNASQTPQTPQAPQAHNPNVYNQPVSTAKATGLIWAIFALVMSFGIIVFIFILPSEKKLISLFEGGEYLDEEGSSSFKKEKDKDKKTSKLSYGEIPAFVMEELDVNADPLDYEGNYKGKVSFAGENLDLMAALTGDDEFTAVAADYLGKIYNCTGVIEDYEINLYSPEIYSERDDESFYNYYSFDYDFEGGIAGYEETDYDGDMGGTYSIKEYIYFLEDNKIYLIVSSTFDMDNGEFFAFEIRGELEPSK